MLRMYDYRCTRCNEQFEALNREEDRLSQECPSCGSLAKFQVSAPTIALNGCDPSFPGAYDKWEKKRKKQIKHEKKDSGYRPD